MEEKVIEIKNHINYLIRSTERYFNKYGWDNFYEKKIARIEASLDILSILTEKKYSYNESGLYEIK